MMIRSSVLVWGCGLGGSSLSAFQDEEQVTTASEDEGLEVVRASMAAARRAQESEDLELARGLVAKAVATFFAAR